MKAADIRRIHYGDYVATEAYPDAGQPVVVTGFAMPDPADSAGTIVFDTGFAPFDESARARPPALSAGARGHTDSGIDPDSVTTIVNCHMHPDHSGGNHEFPGVPIYVQRIE